MSTEIAAEIAEHAADNTGPHEHAQIAAGQADSEHEYGNQQSRRIHGRLTEEQFRGGNPKAH